MKILQKLLVAIVIFIGGGLPAMAGNWWPNPDPVSVICQGADCGIEGGVIASENTITGLITDKTFSEYVIQLIQYLTTFLTLIGVIIIIYAGFTILVSGGDEEKLKSARKMILYAILGIVLIWLAYAIMTFIVSILDGTIEDPSPVGTSEVLVPQAP